MTQINSEQISLGNESALDLLIERNTAKSDLATNLQGKGINADASTETLNELVNKVPNIQSSSDREVVECITTNFDCNIGWNNSNDLTVAKIKGYYFYYYKNNSNLKYFKISDVEQSLNDNSNTNISSFITTINTGNNMFTGKILYTSDYTKLYVICGSGGRQIRYFDIVWDGDTITSVTFNSDISLDGSKLVYTASLDSTNKKLLYTKSDSKSVWLYDFDTSTSTEISGTSSVFSGTGSSYPYFRYDINYVGDNEFVVCGATESRYATVVHFSLNGTAATLIENITGQYQITNTSFTSDAIWGKIKIVQYETGKYKVLIPLEPYTTSKNALKLATYDTYTKVLTEYTKNIRTVGFNSNFYNFNNIKCDF